MKKLSVVLATYNEEKNIASCLKSVEGLADEIIIVDGTSDDQTVVIAKKYGARVTIAQNHPNFHINKQKAIDAATKDWILQLDADEHVSPELKKEIQYLLDSDTEYDGFWIPRKNWFLGRFLMKGGQYPDYTLRLYRRGKGRLPQKDVHEQAVVDGKVGHLRHALLHYPYENFAHYLQKWHRYVQFFAQQIHEDMQKKNTLNRLLLTINLLIVQPVYWFLAIYVRHKGLLDGRPGLIFAFYSALRYPAAWIASLRM